MERTIPGVDATRDEFLPFVSPPWVLPFFGALSLLAYPVAAFLWRALLSIAAVVFVAGALRLSGQASRGDIVSAALFAAAFAPLENAFALGQIAQLASAAAIGALLSRRPLLAGAAAFFTTWQPQNAVPLLALLRSRGGPASLALCAGAIALVAVASASGALATRYPAVLSAHAAAEACTAFQVSFSALACSLNAPALFGTLILAIGASASLVIALRRGGNGPQTFVVLCALTPLWLPFAHEHTLTIAFVPALVCLRKTTGRLWYAAALGALLVATDWIGLWARSGVAAETALLAITATLAIIALAPRSPRRTDLALFVIPLMTLLLGAHVAADHTRSWPESLPPNFHTVTSSAGAAWREELIAAGLTQADPFLALPRLLSIGGCALLVITSFRLRLRLYP